MSDFEVVERPVWRTSVEFGSQRQLFYRELKSMPDGLLPRRLLFERMKILPLYLGASSILRATGQIAAHNSLAFSTGLRTETPARRPKAALVSRPSSPVPAIL